MPTRSRIRRLASETAVYGVSSIVGRLINFLLFPYYSNAFAPDEYGPVIVLYAAFVFLNIVYQHGMESSYLKYASDQDNTADGRSTVFTTATLSVVMVMGVCTLLMLGFRSAFADLIGLDTRYLYLIGWAAGILALDALVIVPFADLRLRNRPWMFAGIRMVNIAVNVGLNIWLISGLGMGVEAILIANAAASAVTLLLLLPFMAVRMAPAIDPGLWKGMLAFGLPFVPGGLGYALTERINIFFLERMPADRVLALYESMRTNTDLAERAAENGPGVYTDFIVGAYGGIIKLAVLMALFVQMFRYAWQPFFLQRQHDDDAPELFGRVFLILTAVLAGVFLAVSFLANDLVAVPLPGGRHLIAPAYWMGLTIIPVALLGYFFQGWYYHFSSGAYIRDKTRYFLHATLAGSAVALLVNALFVPTYGMMAAAFATTAAYATMAMVLLVLVRRHYQVAYGWMRTAALVVSAGALFAVWEMVPAADGILPEVVLLAVFAAVAAVVLRGK